MLASEFFVKDKVYKYIGPSSDYFTYGKTYKVFDFNIGFDGVKISVIIEINIETSLTYYYKLYGTKKVNVLSDGFFNQDIRNLFKCINKKNHLPKWF